MKSVPLRCGKICKLEIMETFYLIIVIFIFLIAVFDLSVGVSNDAVNFLNSAIGSKAASFKVIMVIAAIGIFVGASMSNGMMDIARHGIYQPQYFYLNEIMCILLAVMLTDVVLLDVFNTMGLPTSTTVSMVFELLGGTFALAIVKTISSNGALQMGDLINTDKALQVIMAIFVSVAIAFFFGVVVQYLARLIFKFNYRKQLKYFGALFGGFAATAIIYFILFKGLKESTLMTADTQQWIQDNTPLLLGSCFVVTTILMQILSWCRVNVLKVVVLLGTFALALAFAGNDLVNFIGAPLAGFSAYTDFVNNANGAAPDQFLMTSLLDSAKTPSIFLIGSGIIMVIALFTSKKAQNVIKTSVDLSRQDTGEESFGTSPIARKLVRMTTNTSSFIINSIPPKARTWLNSRFDKDEVILEHGAAFDLVRASVNLVLASLLIALGTSLKLPLSTTYVTFMVAMGTSLADRAWGRDSAVYRITGVISVVGGWFITAGAAFLFCFIVTMIVYYGGTIAIILMSALAAYMLIHSQITYNKKLKQEKNSSLAQQLVSNKDKEQALVLLRQFSREEFTKVLEWSADLYQRVTTGFLNESYRTLRKAMGDIETERRYFKQVKRLGTIGVSHLNDQVGLEKGLYYFQGNDFSYDIIHAIKRACEPCLEHTDNNFNPLGREQKESFGAIAGEIVHFLEKSRQVVEENNISGLSALYNEGNILINQLGVLKREEIRHMHEQASYIKVSIVYLTVIQESQNVVAYSINLLKMNQKFQEENQ